MHANLRTFGFVAIFLFASFLPLVQHHESLELLEESSPKTEVGQQTFTTFSSGLTSTTGQIGDVVQDSIELQHGSSVNQGDVNLSLIGDEVFTVNTHSVAAGTLTGTLDETVSDGQSIQLMTSSSGPSQAGTNSSQLFNSVSWSGVHAYNTLELRCGIVSCGQIIATGDLTLYVNHLVVDSGATILADDLVTGGTGVGTSTTTPSNGRNDGGGGGGHGGAGGDGGGTNGGSGGSTYGNGTERGSQGGGVSSSYHSSVSGGLGGGYIRIYADTVTVNGSIEANGGDGDSGSQATQGTGPGGSGGGGGSGGTIMIQANSINVGAFGVISANGGDGGDGADGAQNGVGFGMYDGGDGGGGGGGGRIVLQTQNGSLTNAGTVQATGGNGGSKGLKYGTGIDGIDGSSGATGSVVTSTWTGYLSTGNNTSDHGTFLTVPLHSQSGQASTGVVTHSSQIPINASLTMRYRWTIGGDNTSWDHWSEWENGSLSNQVLPRHTWLQFEYTFNRTDIQSPTLSAVNIETSQWSVLQDVHLTYDGSDTDVQFQNMELGFTQSVNDTSNTTRHGLSFEIPSEAIVDNHVSLWMGWEDLSGSSSQPSSFVEAHIGTTQLNSSLLPWQEEGHVVQLNASVLQSLIESSQTWVDGQGLEWVTLDVEVVMQGDAAMEFDYLWLPYWFQTTVNLSSVINNMILSECNSYYESTNGVCLGADGSHPLVLSGTTSPSTAPAFSYILDEPYFEWLDAYAPVLSKIEHRQGVELEPDLRVNESFSLVVYDLAGESDLMVEYLGSDWTESDGFDNAQTLTYNGALQGYYLYLSTSGLEAQLIHELVYTFRVMDANMNEVLPRPTYNLTVYPIAPEISSFEIRGGAETTLLSGPTNQGTWDVDGAELTFLVDESHKRMDLDVVVVLSHPDMQDVVLPALWSPDDILYTVNWNPTRSDMGVWSVEISVVEFIGLMGSDEDGWLEGADGSLSLVDAFGPEIHSVEFLPALDPGEPQVLTVSWNTSAGEKVSGTLSLNSPSIQLGSKTVLPTQSGSAAATFDTSDLEPGTYTLLIQLQDDQENLAVHEISNSYTFEVLSPWVTSFMTATVDNITGYALSGEVTTRSGTALVTVNNEQGTYLEQFTVQDGLIVLNDSLLDVLTPNMRLNVSICDSTNLQECQNGSNLLNFSTAFSVDVDSLCFEEDVNSTYSQKIELVNCRVMNLGVLPVSVMYSFQSNDSLLVENVTLAPGEVSNIVIELLNTSVDFNTTLAWDLVGVNANGESFDLQSGDVSVIRLLPSLVDDEEATPQSDDASSSTPMIVGSLFFLILAGIGAFLFQRNNDEDEVNHSDTMVKEELSQQDHELMQGDFNEQVPVESIESTGHPAPETPPTSTDENGYDWCNHGGENYYRLSETGGEWFPYQG